MSSSEQLEREAEASRELISSHLEELRSRMTAGQLVDQVMDYARNGTAGEFAENLRRQVVYNPLPVALIGAGISWLLIARGKAPAGRASRLRRSSTSEGADVVDSPTQGGPAFGESLQKKGSRVTEDASEAARDAASSLTDKARSTAAGVSEYARDAKSRLSESVRSASSSASETLSSVSEGAAERLQKGTEAARETTSALRQRAAETNRRAVALVRDQPLILVGLGLAAGSILGALLPSTDTEDQLMGDASDDLKASGAEIAEHQVNHLKTAAGGAASEEDKLARAGPSAGRSKQSHGADAHTLESSTTVPTEGQPVSVAGNMTSAGPGRS